MGEENILSRIKNTFFSPVRVDVALGKGQLSYDELNSLQVSLKVKPAKLHFYLAGSGVSRSPAPGLYNKLFEEYGLDYSYHLLDTPEFSDIQNALNSPNCLGMSVTIPYKEKIMPNLSSLSLIS